MRRLLFFLFRLALIAAVIFLGSKYYPELSGILSRTSEGLTELSDKGLGVVKKTAAPAPSAVVGEIPGECRFPLAYSIGSIDSRFGVSKEAVRSAASEAEDIWERSASKDIFEYSKDGIPINLVYDERQAETDRLKSKLAGLEGGRDRYEFLKSEYESLASKISLAKDSFESLKSVYESVSSAFSSRAAAFEADRRKYENEVAEWNAKGGAPESEYSRLSAENEALRERASGLNSDLENIRKVYASLEEARDSLNNLISRANAAAALVNLAAGSLNERVAEYNHVAGGREEFVTGFYRSSPAGRTIEVFQFTSPSELSLIIAHELGHAAGLGHAEGDKSIMYPKTVAGLTSASPEDLALLENFCK